MLVVSTTESNWCVPALVCQQTPQQLSSLSLSEVDQIPFLSSFFQCSGLAPYEQDQNGFNLRRCNPEIQMAGIFCRNISYTSFVKT